MERRRPAARGCAGTAWQVTGGSEVPFGHRALSHAARPVRWTPYRPQDDTHQLASSTQRHGRKLAGKCALQRVDAAMRMHDNANCRITASTCPPFQGETSCSLHPDQPRNGPLITWKSHVLPSHMNLPREWLQAPTVLRSGTASRDAKPKYASGTPSTRCNHGSVPPSGTRPKPSGKMKPATKSTR